MLPKPTKALDFFSFSHQNFWWVHELLTSIQRGENRLSVVIGQKRVPAGPSLSLYMSSIRHFDVIMTSHINIRRRKFRRIFWEISSPLKKYSFLRRKDWVLAELITVSACALSSITVSISSSDAVHFRRHVMTSHSQVIMSLVLSMLIVMLSPLMESSLPIWTSSMGEINTSVLSLEHLKIGLYLTRRVFYIGYINSLRLHVVHLFESIDFPLLCRVHDLSRCHYWHVVCL